MTLDAYACDLVNVLDAVGELSEVAMLQRRVQRNGNDDAVESGQRRLLARVGHLVRLPSARHSRSAIVHGQARPAVRLPQHRRRRRAFEHRNNHLDRATDRPDDYVN